MKLKFIITYNGKDAEELQAWKVIELPYIPNIGMVWEYELLSAKVVDVSMSFSDLDKFDAEIWIDTKDRDMVVQLINDKGWFNIRTAYYYPCLISSKDVGCKECPIQRYCDLYMSE